MAVRVPPTLPVPPQFADAVLACMLLEPLQHQDELTQLLSWMADRQQPLDVIVEIGSHRGGTLELWARLATKRVVSIDLPNGVGGGLPDDRMAERDADFQRRFPHVRGIRGDSHDITTLIQLDSLLNFNYIDLLFIDGDHTYEGVKADYEMYRSRVCQGGIIAFHDVTCSPERAAREHLGVNRFFATLPEPKHVFSVGWEWGGIGAIIRA